MSALSWEALCFRLTDPPVHDEVRPQVTWIEVPADINDIDDASAAHVNRDCLTFRKNKKIAKLLFFYFGGKKIADLNLLLPPPPPDLFFPSLTMTKIFPWAEVWRELRRCRDFQDTDLGLNSAPAPAPAPAPVCSRVQESTFGFTSATGTFLEKQS